MRPPTTVRSLLCICRTGTTVGTGVLVVIGNTGTNRIGVGESVGVAVEGSGVLVDVLAETGMGVRVLVGT
jgi:hypothetical protein